MRKEKKKILVAEDDKFIANAYSNALKLEGFAVQMAENGQDALDKLRQDRPDLMLLDLVMPVKDGFDTLQEIRRDTEYKDLPIIVLSNLGQDSDIKQCQKYGISDYLIKSNVSMKEVVQKIKKYLK